MDELAKEIAKMKINIKVYTAEIKKSPTGSKEAKEWQGKLAEAQVRHDEATAKQRQPIAPYVSTNAILMHNFSLPWHEETEFIKDRELVRVLTDTKSKAAYTKKKDAHRERRATQMEADRASLKSYDSKTKMEKLGMYAAQKHWLLKLFDMYAWRDQAIGFLGQKSSDISLQSLTRISHELFLGESTLVLEPIIKEMKLKKDQFLSKGKVAPTGRPRINKSDYSKIIENPLCCPSSFSRWTSFERGIERVMQNTWVLWEYTSLRPCMQYTDDELEGEKKADLFTRTSAWPASQEESIGVDSRISVCEMKLVQLCPLSGKPIASPYRVAATCHLKKGNIVEPGLVFEKASASLEVFIRISEQNTAKDCGFTSACSPRPVDQEYTVIQLKDRAVRLGMATGPGDPAIDEAVEKLRELQTEAYIYREANGGNGTIDIYTMQALLEHLIEVRAQMTSVPGAEYSSALTDESGANKFTKFGRILRPGNDEARCWVQIKKQNGDILLDKIRPVVTASKKPPNKAARQPGTLYVRIMGVENLPCKANVFVCLECEGRIQKTPISDKLRDPDFDLGFFFEVKSPRVSDLRIHVIDSHGGDDLEEIGGFRVPMDVRAQSLHVQLDSTTC